MPPASPRHSRRQLLKSSSAALAGSGLFAAPLLARTGPGRADELRVALVGCGGRGTGATVQALNTAGEVRLVAMADAFGDRLESSLEHIRAEHPDRVDVPETRRFTGFDAYKAAIDEDVDVVIMATPPGFRPLHFEYAVEKGRHVFMEKPVAVDGPGVRKVLEAARVAKEKDLKVGVGLQRHHDLKYQETVQRLHDGAIGEIILLRCYWNSAGVWTYDRQPEQSEMEYQMRNWYYFNWLCGDHIVEQHIHNLDVCNWVMGDYPVRANGQGGRQVRTGLEHGEIFDHHMVEYTYASGAKMISQCRHIPRTWSNVSEHVHGSEGTANISAGRIESNGGWKWRFRDDASHSFQVEHDVLFDAIRSGKKHNEAEYGAKSTLTSILGRMATYSGQSVTWEEALESKLALVPSEYSWEGTPPTLPDAEGRYPIPMPGSTVAF